MAEKNYYRIIVTCIIFNDKNQFLLAKRSIKDDVLPGYWGFPGGRFEMDKTNALDCLEKEVQREVLEEVGVKIKEMQYVGSHKGALKDKVNIAFRAKIASGTPRPLEDTDEVKWCNLQDLDKMKTVPYTKERAEFALK